MFQKRQTMKNEFTIHYAPDPITKKAIFDLARKILARTDGNAVTAANNLEASTKPQQPAKVKRKRS
jgi:hypothetical protein